MVNTEEFTKRLDQIMDYYDLSAASFADQIEVGRSSISHLLSGRNKPSLDFVMKVIKQFPEVELYWLLNGKGKFPKGGSPKTAAEKVPEQKPTDLFSETKPHTIAQPLLENAGKRQIQKIVIFYTDGSFAAYEN